MSSVQTNQDIVLHGNRRPWVWPLSLDTTDQQPVVRVKATEPCFLNGFQTGLSDLSATIFTSRSSIVHHCRQIFGTRPMALLIQIRLSQVNHAYSSPEVLPPLAAAPCMRLPAITASKAAITAPGLPQPIRRIPQATLQRASAPGISIQSVSVTQSPQMAMALR